MITEPISEEDKVVHLLASLPPTYDVLVTALESGSENVSALEVVTERLLQGRRKDQREGNFKGRTKSTDYW